MGQFFFIILGYLMIRTRWLWVS